MALQVDFSRLDAQDVLDIAIQVEQEAKDNYEQLATWLAADGNQEVSRFFEKMAGFEDKHRLQLTAQRQILFGDAPPRHSDDAPWLVEQTDYDRIGRSVSLGQAFELAMEAERSAGDYYAEALEYASDPQVIELFKELKAAEDDHLRMLQAQRDRAFGGDSDG